MNKIFTRISFLWGILSICCFSTTHAQPEIIREIFEKEKPVFDVNINPLDGGRAELVLYFTHSKVSTLEASIWIKDQGTTLQEYGDKQLINGLEEIGNRQIITLEINELKDLHFYTIGVDFRNASGLNRKFESIILVESFRYQNQNPEETNYTRNNNQSSSKPTPQQQSPCFNPDLNIQVDPSGYCTELDRPGILIQCNNCQGKEWSFSVEVKQGYEDWSSLRSDGERQSAVGVSLRTEPLCALKEGVYDLQVLAWGENCDIPVVKMLPTTVQVGKARKENTGMSFQNNQQSDKPVIEDDVFNLPQTCTISGIAQIDGNFISGSVELSSQSDCLDMNPYAIVKYVHPGYRDLNSDEIYLIPGSKVPFEFNLDQNDLSRGIHTIQIIEYVFPPSSTQPIQIGSFWIRPSQMDEYAQTPSTTPTFQEQENAGEKEIQDNTGSFSGDDPFANLSIDEQQVSTINVTASDPNCNQIQDLQLVYGSGMSDLPLFISWLSPRCCQEEGCDYTIWAGESFEKFRLIVQGNKPGAIVRELLQDIRVSDAYFEVVVHSPNGKRKAAYVVGEGPKYGFEEILAFHDQTNPGERDDIVFVKGAETISYTLPEMPIDDFRACRIYRPTQISSNEVFAGDEVKLSYEFSEKGYLYTLYHQPSDEIDWYVAQETEELQKSPIFDFTASPQHDGKYVILAYNPDLNWGCLSIPISEAIELDVLSNE